MFHVWRMKNLHVSFLPNVDAISYGTTFDCHKYSRFLTASRLALIKSDISFVSRLESLLFGTSSCRLISPSYRFVRSWATIKDSLLIDTTGSQ